jgi:hypothetical protein
MLTKYVEQLGKEVAVLESRVGKGEYNHLTTKVLHLTNNPASKLVGNKREQQSAIELVIVDL